jgi:CRISPR-associated protein Csm4
LTAIKLYKLAPRAAFHFGRRGVGVEGSQVYYHADSLFSALCLTLRELDPEDSAAVTRFLDPFPRAGGPDRLPPFRLTSAFPYAGDVLFFPKPLLPARLAQEVTQEEAKAQEHGKTLKSVDFVSQALFSAWLNHQPLGGYLDSANLLHGGELWVTPAERERLEVFRDGLGGEIRLWEVDAVPRVTVDRVTNKSAVYQAGRVRYQQSSDGEHRAGLWVLVEWPGGDPDKATLATLTETFKVLGDSGLGGERSAGYGQFDLEGPSDFDGLDIQGLGERWLTLAPYHPRRNEVGGGGVLGEHCAYALLIRRGWVASPEGMSYRRPLVRMLGEGSVLHHPAAGPRESYGGLADVTPEIMDPDEGGAGHKVWRYGVAFPVPVGIPLGDPEKEG